MSALLRALGAGHLSTSCGDTLAETALTDATRAHRLHWLPGCCSRPTQLEHGAARALSLRIGAKPAEIA